ncbi:MAG: DUF4364 family protein [Oscillospiraceae bacterium]
MEGRFGFIQSEMDLKVLILFILRRLPEPAARDELTDITLLCDGAIGYFDFSECLTDLTRTGHISVETRPDNDYYSITEKGRINGEATESGLPYSVRMRAEKAASTLANIQRRNAMIKASHEMRMRGGFTVKLSMSDGIGPIISMDLLVGDDKQAAAIESRFKKNAESIYSKIIDILLDK